MATAGIIDPATVRIDVLVSGRVATENEATIMRMRAGSGVLVIDRLTHDENGHAVELRNSIADPARVRIANKGQRLTPWSDAATFVLTW